MFSFLHKINPKKRDPSGSSSSSSMVNGSSSSSSSRNADLIMMPNKHTTPISDDFEHINDIKNDLLPTSIEFSPDLQVMSHFPSGKKSLSNGCANKKSSSASSHASAIASFNGDLMTKTDMNGDVVSNTVSSKDSTTSSKLLPFGKNNPFRKSHMSLASLGSGYFTTGRFHDKKHKSAASLG